MSRLRVANLLDDFALGGVTNGLKLFDAPEFEEIARFQTVPIDRRRLIAPALDADVVIVHFPPNWRGLVFLALLRLRNRHARIIHVEHSYSREWERLHVPHVGRFQQMLDWSFGLVDRVIAVSHAQAHWLLSTGVLDADKIDVIHPYSDLKGLADVPDPDLAPGGPLVVGVYGRFHEAKGFEALIDAFKRIGAEARMELVIGGYGADAEALQARAAGCAHIRFFGKVTNVPQFLSQCHVIAVPSVYETYGQVANEAREAGRPILVSQAGGLPEQAGQAGVIVDCTDSDALLAALMSLRARPLAAMGRAGREATRHCRAERIGHWLGLFGEIAAAQAPSVHKRGAARRRAIPIMSSAGQHK